MGLFSKKAKEEYKSNLLPINEHEAWLSIMYCCVATDGHVADAEIDLISRTLLLKKFFEGYDIVPMFGKAGRAWSDFGEDKVIMEAAELISEEHKDTLFAICVELVLVDGILETEEEKVVEKIAKALNINETYAKQIVEVLIVKNRGNIEFTGDFIEVNDELLDDELLDDDYLDDDY